MRTLFVTCMALGLLPALATPAPAHAEVCHGLDGEFHGLCVAYCEALDCAGPRPTPACSRLRARFEAAGGGVLPCDCPCMGHIPDFLEALNGEHGIHLCVDAVLVPPDLAVATLLVTDLGLVGSQTQFDIGACGFPAGDFLLITRQQAERCNALVRQKAAEAGLPCGPL